MANLQKLSEEFDSLIDNMTDAELDNWMRDRESKKALRRAQLLMDAKIQEQILSSSINHGENVYSDIAILFGQHILPASLIVSCYDGNIPNVDYPIAA